MNSITQELLKTLRSPASGRELVADGTWLMTEDGSERYPVVRGVPVLIDETTSAFSIAPFLEPPGTARRFWRFRPLLKRLAPSISHNMAARRNYQRLAEMLSADKDPTLKRVLVVGGAISGEGFEQLIQSDGIDLVESDVSYGPRTQLICDGHALPFKDSTFDAVVCQAVLEHVADPPTVVGEIHRVLKRDGLVYSEIPFIQQVHEGVFDFTRYTLVGHRRLYRRFDCVDLGVTGGPGMALAWSLKYFLAALGGNSLRLRAVFGAFAHPLFFWLKYLDRVIGTGQPAVDAASGTFFFGRRTDDVLSDHDLVVRFGGSESGFALRRT